MQDNVRANTAQVSLSFLDDDVIRVMNWPTSSLDLNQIEHTSGTFLLDVFDNGRIIQGM